MATSTRRNQNASLLKTKEDIFALLSPSYANAPTPIAASEPPATKEHISSNSRELMEDTAAGKAQSSLKSDYARATDALLAESEQKEVDNKEKKIAKSTPREESSSRNSLFRQLLKPATPAPKPLAAEEGPAVETRLADMSLAPNTWGLESTQSTSTQSGSTFQLPEDIHAVSSVASPSEAQPHSSESPLESNKIPSSERHANSESVEQSATAKLKEPNPEPITLNPAQNRLEHGNTATQNEPHAKEELPSSVTVVDRPNPEGAALPTDPTPSADSTPQSTLKVPTDAVVREVPLEGLPVQSETSIASKNLTISSEPFEAPPSQEPSLPSLMVHLEPVPESPASKEQPDLTRHVELDSLKTETPTPLGHTSGASSPSLVDSSSKTTEVERQATPLVVESAPDVLPQTHPIDSSARASLPVLSAEPVHEITEQISSAKSLPTIESTPPSSQGVPEPLMESTTREQIKAVSTENFNELKEATLRALTERMQAASTPEETPPFNPRSSAQELSLSSQDVAAPLAVEPTFVSEQPSALPLSDSPNFSAQPVTKTEAASTTISLKEAIEQHLRNHQFDAQITSNADRISESVSNALASRTPEHTWAVFHKEGPTVVSFTTDASLVNVAQPGDSALRTQTLELVKEHGIDASGALLIKSQLPLAVDKPNLSMLEIAQELGVKEMSTVRSQQHAVTAAQIITSSSRAAPIGGAPSTNLINSQKTSHSSNTHSTERDSGIEMHRERSMSHRPRNEQ